MIHDVIPAEIGWKKPSSVSWTGGFFFCGQFRMKFGLKIKTWHLHNPIAALLILWPGVIVVVFPCLRALLCGSEALHCCRTCLLFVCWCLFISECRYVSGCVHYYTSGCLSMINKGLHSPPSARCILLFLVLGWCARGFKLKKRMGSLSFCTALTWSTTSPFREHQLLIIHLFQWKWSQSMWCGGCCSRVIQTLSSWELLIYYWKGLYYYLYNVTEVHRIGQLISSLKIMKLFGKDSGSQNVGQGTPEGSPDKG